MVDYHVYYTQSQSVQQYKPNITSRKDGIGKKGGGIQLGFPYRIVAMNSYIGSMSPRLILKSNFS